MNWERFDTRMTNTGVQGTKLTFTLEESLLIDVEIKLRSRYILERIFVSKSSVWPILYVKEF